MWFCQTPRFVRFTSGLEQNENVDQPGSSRSRRCSRCRFATPGSDRDAAASTRDAVLEVSELRAGYGRVPVLHGISLKLFEGEAIGIVGHNGMGKSTLLKSIMGLMPTSAGRITVDSVDVTGTPAHIRSRLGIGYVPQGRGILPGLSSRDNLRLAWSADSGETEEQSLSRVLEYLSAIERLARPARWCACRVANSRSSRWPVR